MTLRIATPGHGQSRCWRFTPSRQTISNGRVVLDAQAVTKRNRGGGPKIITLTGLRRSHRTESHGTRLRVDASAIRRAEQATGRPSLVRSDGLAPFIKQFPQRYGLGAITASTQEFCYSDITRSAPRGEVRLMPDKHPASLLVIDQSPSVAIRAAVEGLNGHGLLLFVSPANTAHLRGGYAVDTAMRHISASR
jgi:hypothetical protein